MATYNVNIRISCGLQESLTANELYNKQWKELIHIEGTSHEFHTFGGTPNQVIETIGIELISMLKAAHQKEKEQH